jgi:hypothetical protein
MWMVAQASRLAEARLGAVHTRIFQQAMTARAPGWAKLFLERFDSDYKNQKILEKGGAQQFNFLQEMQTDELTKWLQRSLRKLQGAAGAGNADLDGSVRGLPGSDQSKLGGISDWGERPGGADGGADASKGPGAERLC